MSARTFFQARFWAIALLAFSLIASVGCRSAQKFIESGDYDAAIDHCVRHLKGKKKKDDDYVRGLEAAFEKAQERDLARIAALASDGSLSDNWLKINELHRAIERRQQKIEPLVPLVSKADYQADFAFLPIQKMEAESRKKAAEQLYARSKNLLEKAEKGDRAAAREAHAELLRVKCLFDEYCDTEELLKDAKWLGTSRVFFEVKNSSRSILPLDFERRLIEMGGRELDSEWKRFYFEPSKDVDFDYRVVFKIEDIDVSPERFSDREFVETARIEDGWEYVLDEKGQVKKDSTGRDIKRTRFLDVQARVIETVQTKAARIGGVLEIYDFEGRGLLDKESVGTELRFEHFSTSFVGDDRALSQQTRCRLGSRPVPFPSDEGMLVDAAERIKPEIRSELRRNRAIF